MRRARLILCVALILVPLYAALPARAALVTIVESGSTLFYPLFHIWIGEYAKANRNVRMTATGSGSEAGIAQAISGAAQIGASDAFMSDEQLRANPQIVNIPLAIAAETVNYNVRGLNRAGLKLDGTTIAGIYSGTIRFWDAPQIAALNPGVRLTHHLIVPIRRGDGSGSTFLFTQYLTFSDSSWEKGPGSGTTIAWPGVPGAIAANGNPGMVQASRKTPYSIAYIGTSFHDAIAKAGLGTARIGNQANKFLLPTAATVSAAASVLSPRTPRDERLSLVDAPGDDSYPLVGYEYAIVSTKQPSPATAAAIRTFLLWAVDSCTGNSPKDLGAVRFIALPEYIRALSVEQIEKIH
jgi:phosphate transport system substrate-binding protein